MSDRMHPNVVFIVGDNVGWGDLGSYGGLAPTPRLAAHDFGVRRVSISLGNECRGTSDARGTSRLAVGGPCWKMRSDRHAWSRVFTTAVTYGVVNVSKSRYSAG